MNIPFTDYLSQCPIAYGDKTEVDRKNDEQNEIEAEEKFVLNQRYCLLELNCTNGSPTRFIRRRGTENRLITARNIHACNTHAKLIFQWKQLLRQTALIQSNETVYRRNSKWMKLTELIWTLSLKNSFTHRSQQTTNGAKQHVSAITDANCWQRTGQRTCARIQTKSAGQKAD